MRSARTTTAGIVGGVALLAMVMLPNCGVRLSPAAEGVLAGLASAGLIGLGVAARDARVTSEGGDARVARRRQRELERLGARDRTGEDP